MKSQVLRVSGLRSEGRVTALGGAALGLTAGLILAGVLGWAYLESRIYAIEREATQGMHVLAEEKASLQKQVRDNQSSAAQAQRGLPVLALQSEHQAGLDRLDAVLQQFPVFKTEAYKLVFDKLASELKAQRAQQRELGDLLSAKAVANEPLCAMSPASDTSKPKWSSGELGLGVQGWSVPAVLSLSANTSKGATATKVQP